MKLAACLSVFQCKSSIVSYRIEDYQCNTAVHVVLIHRRVMFTQCVFVVVVAAAARPVLCVEPHRWHSPAEGSLETTTLTTSSSSSVPTPHQFSLHPVSDQRVPRLCYLWSSAETAVPSPKPGSQIRRQIFVRRKSDEKFTANRILFAEKYRYSNLFLFYLQKIISFFG